MHSAFGMHTMRTLQDIKALLSLIGIFLIAHGSTCKITRNMVGSM